jgi:signal transduction histidine kinase
MHVTHSWQTRLVPRVDFASRAATGFVLVTAITAALVMAFVSLDHQVLEQGERALERYADDLDHASRADFAAERMIAGGRGYLLTAQPELLSDIRIAEAELADALRELQRSDFSLRERAEAEGISLSADRYRDQLEDLVRRRALSDKTLLLQEFRERLLPANADLASRLDRLVADERRLETDGRRAVQDSSSRLSSWILTFGAAGVLLSALLAWLFTRHLARLHRAQQDAALEAMRAKEAKDEVLGMVAHDLKNPINCIRGRAALLTKRCADEEVSRSARSIENVAARMDELVKSLLDAAAIESGRLSIARGPCRVSDLLQSTIEVFAGTAAEKSISLWAGGGGGLGVRGDRERILQILSNLVGNAMKFTPDGGHVEIRASAAGAFVRFEVEDTGPGILPDYLSHVFERYWKGEAGGRRGSGLGLYIAKGIVEAHGGRIWVESQPGRGSSFNFELPGDLEAVSQRTKPYEEAASVRDESAGGERPEETLVSSPLADPGASPTSIGAPSRTVSRTA